MSASITEGVEGASRGEDDEGNEEDEDEDDEGVGSDLNNASTSQGPERASVQYRALLEKARKYPLGEKRFKRALIEHAAGRLDGLTKTGATDKERVKAVNEALVDLKRYVSNLVLFCCFVADGSPAPVLIYGRNFRDYSGWLCHRLISITPQVIDRPACFWAHNRGCQHGGCSP